MAVAAEQLSIIRASLDPAGYVAGARQVEQSNQRITQSGEAAARGQQVTQRALEATERSIDRVRTRNDLLYKSQQDLARVQDLYTKAVERGSASAATLLPIMDNLRLRTERLAQANAGVTNAFGVTSRQAQQLAPQINDVITSLLGGASAFQVMTQQGGQITQAMGGVGNTFRALVGLITPARVAMVGLTVAAGAVVLAFENQQSRLATLRRELRGTQADYATFAADLDRRSRGLSASLPGTTLAETRQVQGRLGAVLPPEARGDMENLTRTVVDLSRSLDGDLTSALERVARAYQDPERAAQELADRGIRGFDEAFRRHIELLVLGGDRYRAFAEVMERLRGTFGGSAQDVSELQRAWDNARKGWEGFTGSIATRLEGVGGGLIRWLGDSTQGASRAAAGFEAYARSAALLVAPVQAINAALEAMGLNLGRVIQMGPQAFNWFGQQVTGAIGWARGAVSSPAGSGAAAGASRNLVPIASTDLPVEARAFLNTIAGPESGGRYDVRWGGMAGPQTITDLSRHPNIREPGPAGPSSAAGRYQITGSNWYGSNGRPGLAERYGATDFAPETQDRVAWSWAQDTYRQQTGRDLLEDLRNPSQHGSIAGALGGSSMWHTLNMGRYGGNLAALGGPSAPAAAAAAAPATPSSSAGSSTAGPASSAPAAGASPTTSTQARTDSDTMALANRAGGSVTSLQNLNTELGRYLELQGRTEQGSEQWRVLQSAIDRTRASINGLEAPTERQIEALRRQAEATSSTDEVSRRLAETRQQLDETSRSQRGTAATEDEHRRAEAAVLSEIAARYREVDGERRRATQGQREVADAYLQGAAAGREAEARIQALEEARRFAIPGTAEYARITREITQGLRDQARTRAEAQLAQQLSQQDTQLELLRQENRLVGVNVEERERQLVVIRERMRLEAMEPGLSSTPAGQRSIRNAGELSAEQQAQRWNQEAENYGRQMGTAVSKYLYEGIVEGNWRGIKNLEQSLMQVAWQGLIAKPLETALSSLVGGAMGGTGSSPGLMQQIGTGAASALTSAGNWLTSASTWSWLTGAVVAHDGGWVGGISPSRSVPAAAAGSVRRYHSGGGPGAALAPRELHAILTDDEVVLNGRQQRRAADRLTGGSRQQPVVMNFHVKDAPSLVQGKAQVARAASGFLRGAQRHG